MSFQKQKRIVDKKLLAAVKKLPCAVCGKPAPSDPSHIRTRGSGGPDTDWNVFPKCRKCHILWGRLGWQQFLWRHQHFRWMLYSFGWVFDFSPGGKMTHPKLEKL